MNHLSLFDELYENFDVSSFRAVAEKLHRLEGDESYSNYEKSTKFCEKQLEKAGVSDVRRYALKADGRTAYLDCIMPQAWETTGRSTLTILDDALPEEERILADSAVQPLAASIWSAPTPKEGVTAEVVDADTLDPAHLDVAGKIIFCSHEFGGSCAAYAEAGALGVISCYEPSGEECDDQVRWMNGTGNIGWYHALGDKRIFYFLVTRRKGLAFKKYLADAKKPVRVRAVSATRLYDGKIFTVTGVIPGKSRKEVAMVAHLYEPFVPDDSCGAAAIIELCRIIVDGIKEKRIPKPEKSIRVVLSMELYGMSEYFSRPEAKNILCAASFDSICHLGLKLHGFPQKLRLSPVSNPAATDYMLKELFASKLPEVTYLDDYGSLSDDTFTGDPTIDVPMNWVVSGNPRTLHHNTAPVFMDADWELGRDIACQTGACLVALAAAGRRGIRELAARCSAMATAEFAAEVKRITEKAASGDLTAAAARFDLEAIAGYQRGRLLFLNRFSRGAVDKKEVESLFDRPLKAALKGFKGQAAPHSSPNELIAGGMTIRRLTRGIVVSEARIPRFDRRRLSGYADIDLLLSLFDGKRTLLEAVRTADCFSGRTTGESELAALIADMEYLEKYGYIGIVRR